jgi:hypothetical protein
MVVERWAAGSPGTAVARCSRTSRPNSTVELSPRRRISRARATVRWVYRASEGRSEHLDGLRIGERVRADRRDLGRQPMRGAAVHATRR